MLEININNKKYKITDGYNFSRSAWVETLDEDTKKLILDYTIMWNMVEHQVYDDSYDKNKDIKTPECIENVINEHDSTDKINYIFNLFMEFSKKYNTIDDFYESFNFKRSRVGLDEITTLYNSDNVEDRIRLLIYSCYRVRCNLFHGPKCICYLDEQKLLFLSMNELLSLISKAYGM